MTPEEKEIRENFGIKDEDILQIPAFALWELCRQFNTLIGNEPFSTHLGDCFYCFYCIRIEELAKQKAGVKVALNDKVQTERLEFNTEAAISFFTPGLK